MKKISELDQDLLAIAYKLTKREGYAVLEYIIKNGESTDEEISKAFRVKPNVVRQIIYELEKNNLVKFRKTVDPKTNWVTFYWKPNREFFKTHIEYKRSKIIEKIKRRYEYEKNNMFFVCPQRCIRMTFDIAAQYDFRCTKCNQVLEVDESKNKMVKFLEDVLSKTLQK